MLPFGTGTGAKRPHKTVSLIALHLDVGAQLKGYCAKGSGPPACSYSWQPSRNWDVAGNRPGSLACGFPAGTVFNGLHVMVKEIG